MYFRTYCTNQYCTVLVPAGDARRTRRHGAEKGLAPYCAIGGDAGKSEIGDRLPKTNFQEYGILDGKELGGAGVGDVVGSPGPVETEGRSTTPQPPERKGHGKDSATAKEDEDEEEEEQTRALCLPPFPLLSSLPR